MTAVRVFLMKAGYVILFSAVFVIMVVLLSVAAFGVPAGVMICVLGFAVKLFDARFIVTSLSAELMLFGGLTVAFSSVFGGLLAIKAGFCVSRLYVRVRRKCDILCGWKPF